MARRHSPARPGWQDVGRYIPVPAVILLAHIIGGASEALEAGVVTALLGAMLAGLLWTGRIRLGRTYLAGVRVPIVCFSLVLILAFLSVMPGGGVLSSSWIADRAGLDTLSVDPEATWAEIVKLTGLAAVFVLAHRAARHRQRAAFTLRLIAWASTLWAVWALILYAGGADGGGPARLGGTFVSPNVAGCMLAIGWFCWLGASVLGVGRHRDSPPRISLAQAVVGLVLVTALLLTASRSSIVLTVVLSLIVVGPVLLRRAKAARALTWPRLAAGCAAAVLGLGILGQSSAGVIVRIADLAEEVENRREILRTYTGIVDQAPALGHGLGTVPRISRLLLTPGNDAVMWNVRATHNLLLQWWIEMGLVGLTLAALGLASLLWIVRPRSGDPWPLATPVACVSAFILLQGLVDYSAQIYSICLSWAFLLGLAYSSRITPMSDRTASDRSGPSAGTRPALVASPPNESHSVRQADRS